MAAEAAQPSEEVVPADMEAVAEALRLARLELDAAGGEETFQHFYPYIRGGKWTMENLGMPADTVVGLTRKGEAEAWARRCIGNVQASFAFTKFTRDCAIRLCQEWCRRLQHFFQLVHGRGSRGACV